MASWFHFLVQYPDDLDDRPLGDTKKDDMDGLCNGCRGGLTTRMAKMHAAEARRQLLPLRDGRCSGIGRDLP